MESLGSYLKKERELRQISVAEVAQTTRIPSRIIEQIENDELAALPADVFVRGYLRAYARAVSLDDGDVLSRYQSKPEPEAPAPLPAVYAPEPGRRFGIAIALVILLILFTLALSIVLRPRHRDTPIELSRKSVPCAPMHDRLSTRTPSSFAASTTPKPIVSSRC
ncbi:MAG TPA: helix-turn-helix domain-containing protein [Polyangiales bacterium]|jgi:cytoskeletal protein RodZ|nr:helix-turn-helix domain-containing protein [Polyangiales bacterium]